jgi:hypothetical protein
LRAAGALLLALLAQPAAAQGPPWPERAAELAPALRACLAGNAQAKVVWAWFMDRGLAQARVLLPGGAREDCTADLGTGQVVRREPVTGGTLLPGEGERAFMLDRGCADARRVDDTQGRVLGWLAYPACG